MDTKELELVFDWSIANAEGSEDGGSVVVSLLLTFNEDRDFDQEIQIPLR